MGLARSVWGVPTVSSATDRDVLFPVPEAGQKVWRSDTGVQERYTGTRWQADVGPVFDVGRFGATGDGVTDDTTAIQNAIIAAAAWGNGYGAEVTYPPGRFVYTSPLVIPAQVRVRGAGMRATQLLWNGTSGFGLTLGNSASVLSYGTGLSDLSIIIGNTAAHGISLYGVADCHLSNVYLEGVPSTGSTIGVQIDGADVSAFFILMQNVHANHVFKGFVHTTTGTTKPTQVTGINCSAFCDNTTGSVGIEVQTVGGVGCGDGVTYLGGNMEACKTGVLLNASGTTIIGMRFENTQGVASDVTFDSLARNNTVVGGANIYTITNTAAHVTNQVIGVPKDMVSPTSQTNLLDSATLAGVFAHTGTTFGAFGATPTTKGTLNAAATDPATTQALVNQIRTLLIALGFTA